MYKCPNCHKIQKNKAAALAHCPAPETPKTEKPELLLPEPKIEKSVVGEVKEKIEEIVEPKKEPEPELTPEPEQESEEKSDISGWIVGLIVFIIAIFAVLSYIVKTGTVPFFKSEEKKE